VERPERDRCSVTLRKGALAVALGLTFIYGYGFLFDMIGDPARQVLAAIDLVRSCCIIAWIIFADIALRDGMEKRRRVLALTDPGNDLRLLS
jgi:hypothetical protein